VKVNVVWVKLELELTLDDSLDVVDEIFELVVA